VVPGTSGKRVTFIHIPKNGGLNFTAEGTLAKRIASVHRYHNAGHCTLTRNMRLQADFMFAIVRNPWDRLVSLFHYIRQGSRPVYDAGRPTNKVVSRPMHVADAELLSRYSFTGFLRDFETVVPKLQLRGTHFVQQMKYVTLNDQLAVDDVLRFEDYDAEVHRLLRDLGVVGRDEALDIPVLNRTNHDNYKQYYESQADIDKVRDLYARDIEQFRYDF